MHALSFQILLLQFFLSLSVCVLPFRIKRVNHRVNPKSQLHIVFVYTVQSITIYDNSKAEEHQITYTLHIREFFLVVCRSI